MSHVLQDAHALEGASLVEIFQNRIVDNEDDFADFTNRPSSWMME
jgi:hypothetical protein